MFVRIGVLCVLLFSSSGCVPTGDEAATAPASGATEDAGPSRIPIQRCFDLESTAEDKEPALCEWLNSIDVVAVGEVTSLRLSRDFHSVSYSGVRNSVAALGALGLDDQVPWIDAVLDHELDGQYHLVDSCPVGLSGSNDDWKLMIMQFPPLAIGLEVTHAIKESVEGDQLEFYIGRTQLGRLSGPAFSNESVDQDGMLAPGTVLGVPLTRSGEQGSLVLGWQVPFEVDEMGVITVQESCYPKMPQALNGMTIASLSAKVAECRVDDASVAAGQTLRDERLGRISAPHQMPHFAARCSFLVRNLRQEQDSGLPP